VDRLIALMKSDDPEWIKDYARNPDEEQDRDFDRAAASNREDLEQGLRYLDIVLFHDFPALAAIAAITAALAFVRFLEKAALRRYSTPPRLIHHIIAAAAAAIHIKSMYSARSRAGASRPVVIDENFLEVALARAIDSVPFVPNPDLYVPPCGQEIASELRAFDFRKQSLILKYK
jgi:hypothetical protein